MNNYLILNDNDDYSKLQNPANILKSGGLVLFPTETVYGIGANGLNEEAVRKIYKAKGREEDNPLILHISNFEMLNLIAQNISDLEYKLMKTFWPGPFTIILKKKYIVPNVVTGGLDTVAVRMPSNKIANKLIEYTGIPIAAPSANISGKPSGTCVEDIYDELASKMDYIIDGGKCDVGVESTVVKVEENSVKILRPGGITKEQIEQVVESVKLDEHIFNSIKEGEKVLSPGMKYKHYAPSSKCVLVYSSLNENMVNKINDIAEEYNNAAVICCNENIHKYHCKVKLNYGSSFNLEEISSNIFTLLRKIDKENPDIVIIEGVKKDGLGLAIMNRLIRACSHKYIEI